MMPSLGKTLPRCHSTVRGLMNSWLPISWLVRPSRASLAIWASWAVRSVRVSTVRLRTVGLLRWPSPCVVDETEP